MSETTWTIRADRRSQEAERLLNWWRFAAEAVSVLKHNPPAGISCLARIDRLTIEGDKVVATLTASIKTGNTTVV